jgi:hypothetical protein
MVTQRISSCQRQNPWIHRQLQLPAEPAAVDWAFATAYTSSRPFTTFPEALMAIAIQFDKAQAERLLDCLATGKPIAAPRTPDEALALAGACLFNAMSRAPELHEAVDWKRVDKDPDDEDQLSFLADLHAAVEYYCQLTMLVAVGEYDNSFDRRHKAIVLVEDGEKTVISVEGERNGQD